MAAVPKPVSQFLDLRLDDLRTAPEGIAQRPFRRSRGEHLARTFNPAKFGIPVVNCVEGVFWVIDGQHRLYAAPDACGRRAAGALARAPLLMDVLDRDREIEPVGGFVFPPSCFRTVMRRLTRASLARAAARPRTPSPGSSRATAAAARVGRQPPSSTRRCARRVRPRASASSPRRCSARRRTTRSPLPTCRARSPGVRRLPLSAAPAPAAARVRGI